MADDSKKWDTYSCIAESMAKKHSMTELSAWLSDLSSEAAQWSLRDATGGTGYKKQSLLKYVDILCNITVLLMAVHHKICMENEDLYNMIEKTTMSEYYDQYCEE